MNIKTALIGGIAALAISCAHQRFLSYDTSGNGKKDVFFSYDTRYTHQVKIENSLFSDRNKFIYQTGDRIVITKSDGRLPLEKWIDRDADGTIDAHLMLGYGIDMFGKIDGYETRACGLHFWYFLHTIFWIWNPLFNTITKIHILENEKVAAINPISHPEASLLTRHTPQGRGGGDIFTHAPFCSILFCFA